jgi:hypothetical protein
MKGTPGLVHLYRGKPPARRLYVDPGPCRPGAFTHHGRADPTLPRAPPSAPGSRSNPASSTTVGARITIQPCRHRHRRRPDHDPTLSPPPPLALGSRSNPVATATVGARITIQPCRHRHRRRPEQDPTLLRPPPSAPGTGSNPVPPPTASARNRIQPRPTAHRRQKRRTGNYIHEGNPWSRGLGAGHPRRWASLRGTYGPMRASGAARAPCTPNGPTRGKKSAPPWPVP